MVAPLESNNLLNKYGLLISSHTKLASFEYNQERTEHPNSLEYTLIEIIIMNSLTHFISFYFNADICRILK